MQMCNHFTSVLANRVHSGSNRSIRRSRWLAAFVAMGLLTALPYGTYADSKQPSIRQAGGQNGGQTEETGVSKESLKLFDDLDDIDRLRNLNALKLTPDQLDKAITALTAARDAYNKTVTELAVSRVQKMADEIHSVKRKMLAGAPIPKDFDDRIKQASEDFIAKRKQLNFKNIARLSDAFRGFLTSTQISTAAKMEQDAAAAAQKSDRGTELQWFNMFVTDVIIAYPRIIPLLKEMRATSTEGKVDAGAVGDAGSKDAGDAKGTGGKN